MKFDTIEIEANLIDLDKHFESTEDLFLRRCLGKLALLEYCGWLENIIDEMLLECCGKIFAQGSSSFKEAKDLIDEMHSFSYPAFRKVLVKIFGIYHFSLFENEVAKKLEEKLFLEFKAELYSAKVRRNHFAHNSLKNIQGIDAPSTNISSLKKVIIGFQAFSEVIDRFLEDIPAIESVALTPVLPNDTLLT